MKKHFSLKSSQYLAIFIAFLINKPLLLTQVTREKNKIHRQMQIEE